MLLLKVHSKIADASGIGLRRKWCSLSPGTNLTSKDTPKRLPFAIPESVSGEDLAVFSSGEAKSSCPSGLEAFEYRLTLLADTIKDCVKH